MRVFSADLRVPGADWLRFLGLHCQALQAAYLRRKPGPGLILHSDRGSQCASDRYRKLVADFQMLQSMSRRANCWDNAPMESFFKTLKVERVYQLRYETLAQARLDIVDWIEGFYNHRRMHSSIGYRIPVPRRIKPHGCVAWGTSNRGRVNYLAMAYVTANLTHMFLLSAPVIGERTSPRDPSHRPRPASPCQPSGRAASGRSGIDDSHPSGC